MRVLEEFDHKSHTILLNGEYRRSEATESRDVIDPATENVIAEIAETSAAEIDAAVDAGHAAQKIWWRKSALERSEIMHEIANDLLAMKAQLAEALTREMGKPYKESADEVDWSASAIRYYAETGRTDIGRVMGPAVEGHLNYTLKLPLGVVVSIQPFNYPMTLLAWEGAAALACGNAVIAKPSEYTSLTTLLFAEPFNRHLPPGLFQVVTGAGDAGRRLVEHPRTNMVAFTGSVPTGKAIAAKCGEMMKPSLIETSGNDPFIIMPSAPLDVVARGAAFSAYMNCGQICVSAERFFVHQDIHDEFVEKMAEEARKIRIGNGLDRVEMGPMVADKERSRYEGVLERAQQQGAKLKLGGGRPVGHDKGWFVEPTILTECNPEMDILNNESFGPVAPICKVESFDQALEYANNSRYGLGACLYTMDMREAIRASEELDGGMVWINAPLLDNDAGPFGGTKMSGMGRQLGPEGLETFRKTKFVWLDPNCGTQDFWWFPYQDAESYEGSK
ncbi:MAG: aldehyde dehydrogenase family protein [Gammaproteobacteria bacterium]|nr:aldehyde dehydrogenase family protein [Gammaproteobacteria bacterium]MDH3538159.1 aldehyde dehydrogenase family protein [Gammaproteobacteria bacterium]